jgi:hypothetical protein
MDMPTSALQLNTTTAITGKITADENITGVQYSILNSSGAVATGVTVTGPSVSGDKSYEFKGQVLTIAVGATAAAGTYKLQLVVTAGPVATLAFAFEVNGTTGPVGTPVTTAEVIAGANSNTAYGSSIDLDLGVAWKMADAATNVPKIDLCYAYAGVAGSEKLGTATWAKASLFDFAKNWESPTSVKFYKQVMTSAQFDAITTKEQIPAFVETLATAASYEVAAGDVFLVKTTENVIALIRITAQAPGAAGTISIKLAK